MVNVGALYERLARLLAYHEHSAAAVRAQIRDLARGEADRVPVRSLGVTVRDAADYVAQTHDADRRAARQTRRRGTSRSVIARRQQTAAALAQFDRQKSRRPEDLPIKVSGLGALVRRGYLQPHAGGYVRTAKAYHVTPRPTA